MNRKPKVSLTAVLIQDPLDQGYTAFFAEFPEVVAEGDTAEEAQHSLFEALQIMLQFNREESREERWAEASHGFDKIFEKTYDFELA